MGRTNRIDFHFSGVFHVYPCSYDSKKRDIEDFYMDVFDTRFPSEYLQSPSAYDELNEGDFIHQFLELAEIVDKKDEEFYFEIRGSGRIEYSSFDTYYGMEHDMEYIIEDYSIKFMEKKLALDLGGLGNQVDEDVLNAVIEEENNKDERIFRD